MRKAVIIFAVVLGVFASSEVLAAQVHTGVICTAVVDRTCEGVNTEFPPDVAKVFAHTRIVGMDAGDSVAHRWIYGERTMAVVMLSIGGPDWRTWSSKIIDPLRSGSWKVEVIDSRDGSVMEVLEFTIGD